MSVKRSEVVASATFILVCAFPKFVNRLLKARHLGPMLPMLDALCEYLLEKPGLYRDEMVLFVLDEFDTHVTAASIGRALKSRGWTKKTIRRIAKGRNADLRDLYMHNSWDSGFRSYHYVFVDESGCDTTMSEIGFRLFKHLGNRQRGIWRELWR